MTKLLIICKIQFGYHTDIYKWCEYLRNVYDITVLTLDDGKEKVQIDGIRNIYVPNWGKRTLRGIMFMLYSFSCLLCFKGIVIVSFFNECVHFKTLFPHKHMILDIRTMDVSIEPYNRQRNDAALKKCVEKYDFITCISEGIRARLGVPLHKSAILPLGADSVCKGIKDFDKPRLLYVGTLYNRQLEKTIDGFAMALQIMGQSTDIEYDIIGIGLSDELDVLKSIVKAYGLENKIHLHGYIRHDVLAPFFEKCNVGVSFVPITDYYDFQPPTKTFEYALSGLYVIATDTYSNREIITTDNGCLIQDTPEAFCKAVTDLSHIQADSTAIRESVAYCRWEHIVNDILKPILFHYQKEVI